mmetsp:Transcript_35971/g.34053  ORF Transcript_35971/g.34053 Transcript_35971/m.34053 type:complete len:514 (-) Transcript_35971:200-1741(-)
MRLMLWVLLFLATMTLTLSDPPRVIQKIAVIGAGAGGLVTANVLREDGFDVTIFEKEMHVGGVWKYKSPEEIPSTPMYKSLRTNLPKQIMAFNANNLFSENMPSFLSHLDVQTYLENFAVSKGLLPSIKFGRTVESISYDPLCTHASNQGTAINSEIERTKLSSNWRVVTSVSEEVYDNVFSLSDPLLPTSNNNEDYFDAVIICNGHYNTPLIPILPTDYRQMEFNGKVMHSIDYDNPSQFHGLKVLVIGSKSSGTDLAREIATVADTVYCSDRSLKDSKSVVYHDIHHKPSIISFDPESRRNYKDQLGFVQFSDGSIEQVDIIVWCTGYAYDYPFLKSSEDNCEVTIEKNTISTTQIIKKRKVSNLFQQVFSISNPTLAFVGLPYSVVPFPLFYLQAKWISSIYSNKQKLPSIENQTNWLIDFEKGILEGSLNDENLSIEKYHYLGDAQWNYQRFLVDAAGIDGDQLKYIDMLQEIYNDNSLNRPPYPGAKDDYRSNEYVVNKDSLSWSKIR